MSKQSEESAVLWLLVLALVHTRCTTLTVMATEENALSGYHFEAEIQQREDVACGEHQFGDGRTIRVNVHSVGTAYITA